jgi:glycosyltransferase involved in cell wall biosynthesis
VAGEDVPVLLRNAAALVVPALAEGFGMPIIEAQACGTPVVASDLPVLRGVSGGHCVFFPVGNPPALARALLDAQTRPQQLIEQGLRNARRHSWEAVARRVCGVYAMALGRPDRVAEPVPHAG